jgi:hypothetical protein
MHLASVGNEVQIFSVYDGISKLQYLIKKIYKNFSPVFYQFMVIKTQDPDLEPDPDSLEMLEPDSMNWDPQHCWHPYFSRIFNVS